ncbi:MAG: EpsI family protein, partial [Caldilineaceae bacterium]|nr:EpsI family protein [Caldilineaceae bacterium]
PAQGFAIRANQSGTLQVGAHEIAVRRLMSSLGQRHEPITYWVVVGGAVVTTGIGQKLAQMRYGLRGIIADGMLVRLSNIDPNMARGHALHERFLRDLAADLTPQALPRIFGGGAA